MIHGLFNAKFYALLNTNVSSTFYNYFYNPFMKIDHTGSWVTRLVKRLTLDLTVLGSSPEWGYNVANVEPAWNSLSLSLPLPYSLSVSK